MELNEIAKKYIEAYPDTVGEWVSEEMKKYSIAAFETSNTIFAVKCLCFISILASGATYLGIDNYEIEGENSDD